MSGWIKLHRGLIDWEWYTDQNTCRLFIHCILRANFEDKVWRGISISRGSFYTSLDTLSAETGLSAKQISTSLAKLERTGEVAGSGMARGRMVTVVQYDSYQQDGSLNVSLEAGFGQAEGRVGAADKKVKNTRSKESNNTIDENSLAIEFDNVWDLYGKKGNRKTSMAKFSKLAEEKKAAMIKHIPNYIISTPDKQYRKNLETYINQEAWNDEVNTNDRKNQFGQLGVTNKLSAVERVRATNDANRAARASTGGHMANTDGHLRRFSGQPVRDCDAFGVDSVIEGNYTKAD